MDAVAGGGGSGLDIQTIITIASLLLNVKELRNWFDSRTLQQKATILWHVYSTVSDILLATLWWCMRADGSVDRKPSRGGGGGELGHDVGFSEWTVGGYAYLFWAIIGLKLLTQFPAATATRREQAVYLTYCYAVTVAAHFPFIGCVLGHLRYSALGIAAGVVGTAVCYVVFMMSELTFRLQAPDAFSAAHTEAVATLRFGVEWFYLMIMVLPFSNWQLQLPDYFLLGYAVRVLLWLAYTAVMSKATSAFDEVRWLMFKPVKGGRPGEYEEVGQLDKPNGQTPSAKDAGDRGDDDDDSDDDDDDDDDDEDDDDDAEEEAKAKKGKGKSGAKGKAEKRKGKGRQPKHAPAPKSEAAATGKPAASRRSSGGKNGHSATEMAVTTHAAAGSSSSSSSGAPPTGLSGETVTAQVNGETVILMKKPKAAATPPASGASGSNGGVGNAGGLPQAVHAVDIRDDSSSRKGEKKGR